MEICPFSLLLLYLVNYLFTTTCPHGCLFQSGVTGTSLEQLMPALSLMGEGRFSHVDKPKEASPRETEAGDELHLFRKR